MAFRRGFKSQCERRSVEFRKRLGLAETDPLDAISLAGELDVSVWSTDDVHDLGDEHLEVLNDETDDSWSALTMRIGHRNLIIFKPISSPGRRNSVIMHELAHITLGHHLAPAYVLDDGSLAAGNFDQDQEEEADWLAGVLLLPRPALLAIRRMELSDGEAAARYGVSGAMLTWRLRMTGVDYQISRSRARFG